MRTTTTMTIPKLIQKSKQPNTFCEPVPEMSRKLQLEHHQCVRLLNAVYGLVNAERRWYHRVATDLRTWEEKNPSWNLDRGLSEMTQCWHAVTLHLENVSLVVSTICLNRALRSHAYSDSAAPEPTHQTMERFRDQFPRVRERTLAHQLAITSKRRKKIPKHST